MFRAEVFSRTILGLIMIISICHGNSERAATEKRSPDPFEQNKKLGRGINLGNALDAPNEGEWGVTLKEEYFKVIKDAGFDSVRIPVRWSNHALKEPPYTIDKIFMDRVDWAVKNALKNDLYVMLNIHHYRELYTEPLAHKDRFLGLWRQLAEHYKDYPDSLLLEILNEPDDELTPEMWNQWLKEAHAIIRKANPTKTIVIGSANDNWIEYLKYLELPENDRNIIVTVHHYFPLEFTHQGAAWVSWADPNTWMGTTWTGTEQEKKAMTDIFDIGAAWSKEHNVPLNLGEFGTYEKADMQSRATWTKFIADTAVERNMSFHYWEFCHENFGAYDPKKKVWIEPLYNALIPSKKPVDPFEQNKRLDVGLNLSNALEAPNEGEWGVTLQEEYFKLIRDAGFNSVRIPVSWSTHALKEPPYTIEKAFFDRIDWAVGNAIKNDLYVMLNIQHYRELTNDPNKHHVDRFLGLWKQIAEHYKDYPDSLLFELLNEPYEALTPELWNDLLKKALPVVRKSNPHRTIVVEPTIVIRPTFEVCLEQLDIPEEDRNIIVSVHYYSPLKFTHQGAPWVGERSAAWLGTKWTGTDEEKKAIVDHFDRAVVWGKKNNRPINLGEFGAYEKADQESRARWTAFVAKTAEERDFSRLYWGFCCDNFGVYDRETKTWRQWLLDILVPPKR